MQSSKVITELRTCPNCKQCYGSTEADTPENIELEPTITTQDETSTTNNTIVFNTLPAISNITSEASTMYTSPLNTPTMTHISMVASPSIVSVHSNAGSPPSTPDELSAMTLPGMSTSDADRPKISTAESLKISPLCDCPANNSNLPRSDVSTSVSKRIIFT